MGQGTINKLYFRTVPTIRQYREDKWGKKMIEVRMLDEKETEEITKGDTQIPHIEKEAFDKDSLVLLHTQKSAPHIVLDMNSLNAVKTYPLPDDLANEILKDKQAELNQRRHKPNNRNRNNR